MVSSSSLFAFVKPLKSKPPTALPTFQAFSSLPPTTDVHHHAHYDHHHDNDHLRPLLVEGIEVDVPKVEDRGKHLDDKTMKKKYENEFDPMVEDWTHPPNAFLCFCGEGQSLECSLCSQS